MTEYKYIFERVIIMTITAYYPIIYVNDMDAALKQYTEELGFEKKHVINGPYFKEVVLANGNYRIDLTTTSADEYKSRDGFYAMRVNVREFDEALQYYKGLGYQPAYEPVHTPHCDLVELKKEGADSIFLFHHIRKDENTD